MRNGRLNFVWGFLFVLMLLGACRVEPEVTAVSYDCNPLPKELPPLPDFIQSIRFPGPEVYGPVHSLHSDGELVYLGFGDSFAVLDASEPTEPRLLGQVRLGKGIVGSEFTSFAIQEDVVFFEQYSQEFAVDVRDPSQPFEVVCGSSVPWPEAFLTVDGRFSIQHGSYDGLSIWEHFADEWPPKRYVGDYNEWLSARLAWERAPGQVVPRPYYIKSAPMYVQDFTSDGRYIYLVNVSFTSGYMCCGRLTIVDMEDPAKPKRVATIKSSNGFVPYGVDVIDDWLFLTLYDPVASEFQTTIYDIEDRTDPVALDSLPRPRHMVPYMNDDIVYFLDFAGIEIWDLGANDGPEFVSRVSRVGGAGVSLDNALIFVDDYLYVASGNVLEVLDIRDQENLFVETRMEFPQQVSVWQLSVSGDLISFTNPNPVTYWSEAVLRERTADNNFGEVRVLYEPEIRDMGPVLVNDDYSYLLAPAWSEGYVSLIVVDNREPFGSNIVSSLDIGYPGYSQYHMAMSGQYIYLIGEDPGPDLIIIEVSDVENPVVVNRLDFEKQYFEDLTVWKNNLFLISSGLDNLWHFDVTNPARPALVDRYDFNNYFYHISAGDGFLFSLDWQERLVVFDLGSSSGPDWIGSYYVGSSIVDLEYDGGILYLALGNRGMAEVVLDLEKIGSGQVSGNWR